MATRRPPRRPTPSQLAAERERVEWWIKIVRDVSLLVAGIGLTVNEALTRGPERPSLYVVFVGMMGLGPVLRFAESVTRAKGGSE